jgi:hypothetical protein
MNILEKIKKFVDTKNKEIIKILDPNKNYRISFFKRGKTKSLQILYNDKVIIAGDYNFYGIYQPKTNLWIWASSIHGVELRHINNIRKMKTFSHLFEASTDIKMNFYFQLLTQDVIYISDGHILDWINELILYLSKDIFFFNPVNSNQNVQFITLVNIKEKYL